MFVLPSCPFASIRSFRTGSQFLCLPAMEEKKKKNTFLANMLKQAFAREDSEGAFAFSDEKAKCSQHIGLQSNV